MKVVETIGIFCERGYIREMNQELYFLFNSNKCACRICSNGTLKPRNDKVTIIGELSVDKILTPSLIISTR